MTDRKTPSAQQNETPADVAALYSWANLQGAKYRDFSAARAQTRERVRQRVIGDDPQPTRLPSPTPQTENPSRPLESPSEPPPVPQSRQLAPPSVEEEPRRTPPAAVQKAEEPAQSARVLQAVAALQAAVRPTPPTDPRQPSSQPDWRAVAHDRYAALQPFHPRPQNSWQQLPPGQAESEEKDSAFRPAWLASEPIETTGPAKAAPVAPPTPEDTLEETRDRLASRWFALKSVFEGADAPVEPASVPTTSHPPVVAVFSLAGGVGKTSIVATLGRALAARGERVLLVDTASFGLLPFFFGAQDQRLGQLRTFTPPSGSGDASIQLITIDPEASDAIDTENPAADSLTSEIARYSRGTNRIIVDLASASGATTRRILKMNPLIVIPVVPDMNSVVSVGSLDSFFERNAVASGSARMPYYVLNRFDASLPLHLDVREVLRQQLGDRLLHFPLHHAPAVSEALADGMTVIDYAPNSAAAEDFVSLAGWVKSLSAPAVAGIRGVRWSER